MKNYKMLISRISRTTKAIFCGCLVVMTCSCEDFLTIYPTDKIVSDDFWKTKGDVENVAAESYRLMTQWDFLSRVLVWGELRGDNVIEGNFGGNSDIINIVDGNLLPTNGYASWAPFYQVINNCNIVLEYAEGVKLEDPDFTEGDCDLICGEMYAIRALCHFYLVRTFRDIPLLNYAVVDNTQPLYQRQEDPIVVLDSCLSDLYKAEELVFTSGNYVGASDALKNKGRITKDAVRAMIADVLLWKAAFIAQQAAENGSDASAAQECYTQCIEYCDMVLDARTKYWNENKTTDLKSFFATVTTKEQFPFPILFARDADLKLPYNKRFSHEPYMKLFGGSSAQLGEGIFEIQHTTSKDNGNSEVPYFYGYADDKNNFKIGMLSASRYLAEVASNVKDESHLYTKSDFRRVTYINSETGTDKVDQYPIVKFGYSASKEDRSKLDATSLSDQKKFGIVTYTFWKNNSEGGRNFFTSGQVNWIVYRISDIMLMKAEALSLRDAEGDLEQAFHLVNAVYTRSQAGHTYYSENTPLNEPDKGDVLQQEDYNSANLMYELVLKERQREFAFEGKRWYDLVRVALHDNSTNRMLDIISKAGNNPEYFSEYRLKMSSIDNLFFPIAEREINVSNGFLEQNDAYKTESDVITN